MGEKPFTGPDLVRDTSEKVDLISKRLLMAESRLKKSLLIQTPFWPKKKKSFLA